MISLPVLQKVVFVRKRRDISDIACFRIHADSRNYVPALHTDVLHDNDRGQVILHRKVDNPGKLQSCQGQETRAQAPLPLQNLCASIFRQPRSRPVSVAL